MSASHLSNQAGSKVSGTLITIMTWVLVLLFFFPVLWMFLNAFKSENDASSSTPLLFFTPDFSGFEVAARRGFTDYLKNSVFASLGATVVILLLAIPAAYAVSIRPIKRVQDPLFFFI